MLRNDSRPLRGTRTLALTAATAVLLGACSAAPEPVVDDGIRIVASTTVYAAIAGQLAGDRASVTAIIDNPAQDPHSYEATARDQLAVADADLLIANGGGYDDFMEALRSGIESSPRVIHAVDFLSVVPSDDHDADHTDDHDGHGDESDDRAEDGRDGHDHAEHGHLGVNEHVWFSLDTIQAMARGVVSQLQALDPDGTDVFRAGLAAFEDQLAALRSRAATIAAGSRGLPVVVTEPVAEYLIDELGLDDLTPAAFPTAIEQGLPVAPATLLDVLVLVESGELALLVVNPQTASPETDRVAAAAEQAGVPILEVRETLPAGTSYFEWMLDLLEHAETALQR